MKNQFDKIRILVLDDNPETLQFPDTAEDKATVLPRVNVTEWEPFFEVLWLATVEEARDFRDAFRAISFRSPVTLGEIGVVPEVLLFDYALAGNPVPVDQRVYVKAHGYNKISPFPRLRQAHSDLDVPPLAATATKHPNVTPLEMNSLQPAPGKAADNYGCYAGGLLLEAFSGHPCAGVPTTRWGKEKTMGTEAAVFEWLLERDAGRAFEEKGRTEPHWEELLPYAMRLLRERIEQLDEANMITLDLDDLFTMSNVISSAEVLQMWSRYGLRRLPVNALFLDQPKEQRRDFMAEWAKERLESLVKKLRPEIGFNDFKLQWQQAVRLADDVWNFFENSELPLRRWRLHELAAKNEKRALSLEETKEFQAELNFWVSNETGKCESETSVWSFAEKTYDSDWVIRWAVLLLILRLHEWKSRVKNNYIEHYASLIGNGAPPSPTASVMADDVYRVLYPVPRGNPKIDKLSTTHAHDLMRLGSKERDAFPLRNGKKDNNAGNLGLRIEDVLSGRPWVADSINPRKDWMFGLIRGEKFLLRSYALKHGLKMDARPLLRAIFA